MGYLNFFKAGMISVNEMEMMTVIGQETKKTTFEKSGYINSYPAI